MLEYLLWVVSFLGIWLVIIWIHFLFSDDKKKISSVFPSLTVVVPVFNEEKFILKTLKSLRDVDYPKDKLKVFVSDDGSNDKTADVVKNFISSDDSGCFSVFSDVNSGKGAAVNKVLDKIDSDFFIVVDADSRVKEDAFKNVVSYFHDEKVGAVISRVVVDIPEKWIQKMQSFEYVMSNMLRKVMHNFGTLAITHGAFTVFRTGVLKRLGGFDSDRNNITEDLEIALRLKDNGFKVLMAHDAVGYTIAPRSFKSLWKQRIRWYRGYLFNHWKYRHLFFSSNQGVFGFFQLPINFFAIALSVVYFSVILMNLFSNFFNFVSRSFSINNYFVENFLNFPSLKVFLLAQNFQIYIPIFLAFILTVFLALFAHKFFKLSVKKSVLPACSYFIVMPYFTMFNWLESVRKEIFRSKRKW
jgi:cellulose synthase/poly-beta-1,6-N-acetylglucosamine synthase-like glycosyltransferase